jgi:hypothetical protein
MKSTLFLLCCIVSFNTFAQTTYLADTAFYTDIGYGGAEASCKAAHLAYNGWQMTRSQHFWVADAFTVPSGTTWTFDTVIVYGYQYGSTTTSSFLNANLQIYNSTPGLGGAVIWGDTVTNVLVSTGWTGIYKVDTFASDNGLNNFYRPIMYLKLYLAAPPTLSGGTYWLSWSVAGSLTNSCVAPDKVLPGRINPPGQTARGVYNGIWQYLTDSGQVNGLNMIIKATAGLTSVPQVQNPSPLLLAQNAPNPFNNETTISYYLPLTGYAKLSIYNIAGQLIATPVNGEVNSGNHQVRFKAGDLASGTYFYEFETSAGIEHKQMNVVR